MKKIFLLSFLLVLVLTGVYASGGKETGTNPATKGTPEVDLGGKELRYIAWWDPTETNEVVKAKIAYYEEMYNFKLKFINSGDWQAHHDNLVASVAAGDPMGEMVYIDQGFFASYVTGKIIQPVDGYGIDFSQPYYHQVKRAGFTLLGHEYGIKNTFIEPGAAMWFNKSLLEREGIESIYDLQKNGKWNWAKMLEIAKKVTKDLNGDGTIDQWGFGEDPLHVTAMGLLASNGANIVDKGKLVIDSPQALEALQFYQDLNVKHKIVAMRPEGSEWNWAYAQFGAGKIAFLPFWFWGTGQFGKPTDKIGWALIPAGPKGKMTSIAIPNNTIIIPVGVQRTKDILFVWDKLWAPDKAFIDPNEDPYGWLYNTFYDIESVEQSQVMMSEKGYYTIFTQDVFGLKPEWEALPGPILTGEKSPAAAVQAAKPVMEAKLAKLLGK